MKEISCIRCRAIEKPMDPTNSYCQECFDKIDPLTQTLTFQAHNIWLNTPDHSKHYTAEEYRKFEFWHKVFGVGYALTMVLGPLAIVLIWTKIFGVW